MKNYPGVKQEKNILNIKQDELLPIESQNRIKYIQARLMEEWVGLQPLEVGKAGTPLTFRNPKSSYIYRYNKIITAKHNQIFKDKSDKPPLVDFCIPQRLVQDPAIQIPTFQRGSIHTKELLYKMIRTDCKLIRSILEDQNFQQTDQQDWNILWIGSSAKQTHYECLNEYQRVNHFPFSFEITRKDKMCSSIQSMQERFGYNKFGFIPTTFVIPDQMAELEAYYNSHPPIYWIIKPSGSSQGRGIRIHDSLYKVPIENNTMVVQKYIQKPLLINGLKFDLRIYAAITSIEPLKIYVYREGLARFASENYEQSELQNKYMHLTNYSVNKDHENFTQNTDNSQDNVGNKWSLSALFKLLARYGIDTDLIWSQIYDIIIKSIISIEQVVKNGVNRFGLHRNNCFDLLGFDILIDSELKPWLLEINLSPSLNTDSPLDFNIKAKMLSDLFNMIQIHGFDRRKETYNRSDAQRRMRQNQLYENRLKAKAESMETRIQSIIKGTKFREIVKETIDQYQRRGNFIRIYPSKGCEIYDQYFEEISIINKALYHALYQNVLDLDTNYPLPDSRSHTPTMPRKARADTPQSLTSRQNQLFDIIEGVMHTEPSESTQDSEVPTAKIRINSRQSSYGSIPKVSQRPSVPRAKLRRNTQYAITDRNRQISGNTTPDLLIPKQQHYNGILTPRSGNQSPRPVVQRKTKRHNSDVVQQRCVQCKKIISSTRKVFCYNCADKSREGLDSEDLLIEYISRVNQLVSNFGIINIKPKQRQCIKAFNDQKYWVQLRFPINPKTMSTMKIFRLIISHLKQKQRQKYAKEKLERLANQARRLSAHEIELLLSRSSDSQILKAFKTMNSVSYSLVGDLQRTNPNIS